MERVCVQEGTLKLAAGASHVHLPPPNAMSASLDIEASLSEHGPFLTRLARALTRDAHGAEDLVQDVMAQALAQRPVGIEQPKAWLARVMRNLASNRRRRTTESEWSAALQETPRDTNDPLGIAERMERERLLHGALESLREPFRTALVLRYRDGCAVKEIAELMGTTVPAAQSNVHRGKALLREKLELEFAQEEDPARAWLAALSPLLIGRARGAGRLEPVATAGGTSKAPALLAAALMGLVGVGVWTALRSPASVEEAVLPGNLRGLSAAGPEELVAVAPAEVRAEISAVEPPAQESAEDTCAVILSYGGTSNFAYIEHPVLLRRAELGQSPGPIQWKLTDDEGLVHFDGLAPGRYEKRSLFLHHWQAIEVSGDTPSRQSNSIGSAPFEVRGRARFADGTVAANATIWLAGLEQNKPFSVPVTLSDAEGAFVVRDCHGASLFATSPDAAPSDIVDLTDLPLVERGVFSLDVILSANAIEVRGILTSESGSPVTGAQILIRETSLPKPIVSTKPLLVITSDENGRFAVPGGLRRGPIEIEAVAAGHGQKRFDAVVGGSMLELNLRLPSERVIHGIVIDEASTPIAGATVAAVHEGETWESMYNNARGSMGPRPMATSADDGTFTMRGLGPERVTVSGAVNGGPNGSSLGTAIIPSGELEGSQPTELRLRSLTLVTGTIVDPTGTPLNGVSIGCLHPTRGEIVAFGHVLKGGKFNLSESTANQRRFALPKNVPLTLIVNHSVKASPLAGALRIPHATFKDIERGGRDIVLRVPVLPKLTGSLKGRITSRQGADLDQSYVNLRSALAGRFATTIIPMDRKTGEFEFGPLPAGGYVLEVKGPDHQVLVSRAGLEIGPTGDTNVGEVEIGSGGYVALVVDPERAATLGRTRFSLVGHAGVQVDLYGDGPTWQTPHPIEPGDWIVRMRSAKHVLEEVEISVTEGAETRITLEPKTK